MGDSYALNPWSSPSFSTSRYSDAANRIAWAIENDGLSGLGPAATQLLIWSISDKSFSVSNRNGNRPFTRPTITWSASWVVPVRDTTRTITTCPGRILERGPRSHQHVVPRPRCCGSRPRAFDPGDRHPGRVLKLSRERPNLGLGEEMRNAGSGLFLRRRSNTSP